MDFSDGISAILRGNAIIFYGAGFSIDNKNILNENVPLTNKLSYDLQKLSGIDDSEIDMNVSIQNTSEYFIEVNGESKLVELLKQKFTVSDSTEWQKIIARQNWKRVYTTNYDNVFETASNEVKKHRVPININDSISNNKDNTTDIVHLNGYVDDITEGNLANSTKLTSESYTDTYFIEGPWRNEFEIDLEHSQAIFFVGFSLDYDLDLKRIIYANKKNREKIYFINGSKLNKIQKSSLSKFGKVLDMNADEFAQQIHESEKTFIPINRKEIVTLSFEKSRISEDKTPVSDSDISDLFFYGKVNKDKIYSFTSKSEYTIERTKENNVEDYLSNFKGILVQGKLGNGKSIFLKNMECELVKKGYNVYVYNGNPNDLLDDIEKIKSVNELTIIIIDDYYAIKSQFPYFFRLKNNNNIKLILAGRTYVNENTFDDFLNKTQINSSEIITLNVDEIDRSEMEDTYNLIENHNLWGKKSSFSPKKKHNALYRIGKNGYQNVALEIVKSNNIVKRISDIYSALNASQQNFIIAILINNLLQTHLRISQISTLTRSTMFSKSEVDDANFKEFVDIDDNTIIIQSSVAAREILKEEKNKNKILNIMETMLKIADKIDTNKTYEYLKKQLVSFSNFRLIVGDVGNDQMNELAVRYFENIRNSNFCKENPFFWLQYGIQRLNAKDYDLADSFFDNALSFADKRGLSDFYQINAQKARGLIERLTESETDVEQAYSIFEKAHSLLISDFEKSSNNQGYQLSQGRLYEMFYNKYYKLITSEQKIDFNNKTKKFESNLQRYILNLESRNSNVEYKIIQSRNCLNRVLKFNPDRRI